MISCAITDHGNMSGHIEFYKELKKKNIKPLLGIEAYITQDPDGIEDNKDKVKDNWHCILIARNLEGYKDLIWLNNQATLYNFYYKPRISLQNLVKRSSNLIATSSCLGGICAKCGKFDEGNRTFDDHTKQAEHNLGMFRDIFHGNFYAEIQDDRSRWEQCSYNEWLIKRAQEMSIPLVITSDAHFLHKTDKRTHDIVMAQQLKITLQEYQTDDDGMSYGENHYVRLPEEMKEAAKSYGTESAYWNTEEIAKKCNVELELGKYKTPTFPYQEATDYQEFKQWKASKFECLPNKK
jgi:DNA polymerase-3 subunit alpha